MSKSPSQSFNRYFPVDNNSIDFGLYITGYGYQEIPAKSAYPPREHPPEYAFDFNAGRKLPEFQLIYIAKAEQAGTFESKDGVQEIPEDSFFMLTPDFWHRYRPNFETGWREYWVSFNGRIALRYFSGHAHIKDNRVYQAKSAMRMEEKMKNFFEFLKGAENYSCGLKAANLFGLIAEIEKPFLDNHDKRRKAAPKASFKDVVKEVIWGWSHTDITAEDIARELGITTRTLFRKVAKYREFSVADEINLCKISRAKNLISTTDIPLKSVAHLAGFKNVDCMRMAFSRHLNTTPYRLRKNFVGR